MENVNYAQLYKKITKSLSPKTRDIFERRFGITTSARSKLGKGQTVKIETLESIGDTLRITRERVRQIEEAGFNHIRKNHPEAIEAVWADFGNYFANHGGFKREDIALQDLGGKTQKPYILFFLSMAGNMFARVCGKKDYHYFWAMNKGSEKDVITTLDNLVADLDTNKQLLEKQELHANFVTKHGLPETAVASYLEISKKIQANKEGKIGLVTWPEINPRGVKDKAFLVFKKHQKPLHFTDLTKLIDTLDIDHSKKTHAQTVHNELIKDARFVLVGRGTYALAEWGYVPGTIKDIITKVLKEKQTPVPQEEVVKEVLNQRLVAKNTVMINLNNKKHFAKDAQGRYFLHETQTV